MFAQPLVATPVLPTLSLAIAAAIVAALSGRAAPRPRMRRWVFAVALTAVALAGVVALRGPAGLEATLHSRESLLGRLAPGPIDVTGIDLAGFPAPRRRRLTWEGALRVPESGDYRLRATGRGRVAAAIDGVSVLEGAGDPLDVAAVQPLGRGERRLRVTLSRRGPGPRLRLEWTRPDGVQEPIPVRWLGEQRAAAWWLAIDALALLLGVGLAGFVVVAPWDRRRRLPLPGALTRRELLASAAGYGVLAALLTWPLVTDLTGSGVVDRPDGRLNAWILAWDAHALLHRPGRLFDAPIFHPLPDALAFSENLLLLGAALAPATQLGGPVLGYNLALLLCLVVSGIGTQLLVRRVTGDRLAAFVAGCVFAFGPHRWIRLAHLHAQATLVLPFVLLAFDHFWERRRLGPALLVGVLLALQAYASIYLGAITAATLAVAIGLALFGGLRPRELVRLAVGLTLAGVLLAPLAAPYLRMRAFQGMEFGLDDLAIYSTTLTSWAASGTPLLGPLSQRHLDPAAIRDALFPGVVPLLLGIAGLVAAPRRYRWVALVASGLAIVLSLGPATAFYRFLHEHVVLVRGIRALSRFALVPMLALAVLAGFTLAGRRRLSLLALALLVVESCHAPLRLDRWQPDAALQEALAAGEGPVVFLPLGAGDTAAMLASTRHFRPLVNGDSGFIPRSYDRTLELLEGPVDEEGLRFLRALGVSNVVSARDEDLVLLGTFASGRLYAIAEGAAASLPARGSAATTLWGVGATLDRGDIGCAAGIAFEIADGPWVARPAVSLSVDGTAWHDVTASASLADATLALTRDPRGAWAALRFAPTRTRFLKLDPQLPARRGALEVIGCPQAAER